MKFCGGCGAQFKQRCPQCSFENPPQFKFCGECGTPLTRQSKVEGQKSKVENSSDLRPVSYTPKHLAERILAEREAMEARGVPDGERKTITALFADIKGSTSLIEALDPEEARRIIDPALKLMMDAVHRYEGYVAQSMGDGIFALFGAPIAHEDHAQRATNSPPFQNLPTFSSTRSHKKWPTIPCWSSDVKCCTSGRHKQSKRSFTTDLRISTAN
jgi:hypothetical protein